MPPVGFPVPPVPAPALATGASVYVDKQAGVDDAADPLRGTQAKPFRTITASLARHVGSADTTFWIAPTGVYDEQVDLTSKVGRLRLTTSNPAARPIIDGGETRLRGINHLGQSINLTIEGLEVRNMIQDGIRTGGAALLTARDNIVHRLVFKKGLSTDVNASLLKHSGTGDQIYRNVFWDNPIPGEARGVLSSFAQGARVHDNFIGFIRKEGIRDATSATGGTTPGGNWYFRNTYTTCWNGFEASGTLGTRVFNSIFFDCGFAVNAKHIAAPGLEDLTNFPKKFEGAKHPVPAIDDPLLENWMLVDHNTFVRMDHASIWNNETPPPGDYVAFRNNLFVDAAAHYFFDFPVSPDVPYPYPPPATVVQPTGTQNFRGSNFIYDGNGYVTAGVPRVPNRKWSGSGYGGDTETDPTMFSTTIADWRTPKNAGRRDPHAVELALADIGFSDYANFNFNHPGTIVSPVSVPQHGLGTQMGARNVPVWGVGVVQQTIATASASHGDTRVASVIDNRHNTYWYTGGNYMGPDAWINMDFGSVKSFTWLKVQNYNHNTGYNLDHFDFELSADGVTWTLKRAVVFNDPEQGTHWIGFDELITTRYLRMSRMASIDYVRGNPGTTVGLNVATVVPMTFTLAGQPSQYILSTGAAAPTPSTPPANTTPPSATPASAVTGQTLTTTNGTWSGSTPLTYTYQWRRGTTNLAGQTARTYTLTSADVGQNIFCVVRATDVDGLSTTANSNVVVPTAPAPAVVVPANTVLPQVTPSPATVGQPATTDNGTWNPAPTSYAYQWLRSGSPIVSAAAREGPLGYGFYGPIWGGETLRNLPVGGPDSRRPDFMWRADFTGAVNKLRFYFIFTDTSGVNTGYNGGNGGDIKIEMCADSAGSPGTVLASVTVTDPYLTSFRTVTFSSVNVVDGTVYHFRFTNVDPASPTTNYVSVDNMGFNNDVASGNIQIPIPNADLAVKYSDAGGAWVRSLNQQPIFTVFTTDGAAHGPGCPYTNPRSVSGVRQIQGALRVAELFTPGEEVLVTGFGIRLKKVGAPPALTVRLMRGATVIDTVTIPAASVLTTMSRVTGVFGAQRTLLAGSAHRFELSCPTGTATDRYETYPLTLESGMSASPWAFPEGEQQTSGDGGTTWTTPSAADNSQLDFTVPPPNTTPTNQRTYTPVDADIGTGTLSVRVTASNGSGAGTPVTSPAVNVAAVAPPEPAPDTTAPTGSITAPAPDATVSGTVTINVTATDESGVAKVDLLLDGATLLGSATVAPYSFTWETTTGDNGPHTLRAVATDASPAGNSAAFADVAITVANAGPPPPDPPPPDPPAPRRVQFWGVALIDPN